jgi:hypothetical protein
VGDDMKARILMIISELKVEFCNKTVERLEPVIADTVMKTLSTNEKLFSDQKINPPVIPRAT